LGSAGAQVYLQREGEAYSNDDLVGMLRNQGVLADERVQMAMLACDRRAFVPTKYKDIAYVDQPIHISEWMSNISAPHIYTTFLCALDIQEGMSVMDVGSGSGISSAYCAMLAGKFGMVSGIDTNGQCVEWANEVLRDYRRDHASDFGTYAAPIHIQHGDAFIACYEENHKGKYDRVFVGASCPRARVHAFISFLKPSGGKIVVPVSPSELILIHKPPGDAPPVLTEILKVRFTELDVPSEIKVMNAVIKSSKRMRLKGVQTPSTYQEDLQQIASLMNIENTMSYSPQAPSQFPRSPVKAQSILSNIGEPDCILQGSGWHMNVHSVMLKQRCQYFKARAESGMKDSSLSMVVVPDAFSEATAQSVVEYLYTDKFNVNKQNAVSVLQMSHYYGVPRLTNFCEILLGDVLKKANRSERHIREHCDAAIELLNIGLTLDLTHLTAVALDFLASNYGIASEDESFATLDTHQVALIAEEACLHMAEITKLMDEMQLYSDVMKDDNV
jgi:protein-L-isoaspartate(D-aspartate) O-methyltransferase